MENFLAKDYTVSSSLCDAQGKLGIRNIFDICMDLAAYHALALGVGYYEMLERRCYWVAVRTRVRLYERPILGASFKAETWPGKPSLAKADRFYRLTRGDTVFTEGRTEWAAQDIDTGMIRRTDSYGFPTHLAFREEKLCAEPFVRFKITQSAPEELAQVYTVGSMDIDVGQHMNNVAYIRMLLGTFTTAELAAMDISEVEVSYRSACFEGEELSIYRQKEENAWRFQVEKPDGSVAVHALITLR